MMPGTPVFVLIFDCFIIIIYIYQHLLYHPSICFQILLLHKI